MVHSHNTEFREFDRDYAYASEYQSTLLLPEDERASFQGYVRSNGKVGTRNFIGILSTVNCSATVVNKIADWFTPEQLKEFPNVDGVVAFSHDIGCGMEMSGAPMELLRRTMAGYARHPNLLAAALIVGLGCERNQLRGLMEQEELTAGQICIPSSCKNLAALVKLLKLASKQSKRFSQKPTKQNVKRCLCKSFMCWPAMRWFGWVFVHYS